jgi:agmatine deiminase
MRPVLIILICLVSIISMNAQTINHSAKLKAKEKLLQLDRNDFQNLQKPKFILPEKQQKYNDAYNELIKSNSFSPKFQSTEIDMDSLPTNFRIPGEFEESQAVLVSWPSYAFDENGKYLEPFTPGKGLFWSRDDQGNWDYEIRDIAGYVLDLYTDSPFPPVWAELVDAIQQEATAWIRVAAPEDTTDLKNYMYSIGKQLVNYEFLFDEDGENAFWARDFGPFGAYYGDEDSLMFVIAEYYPGRPIDDLYPVKLAQRKGYKYYKSPLELEGGNFMTDGHGAGFYGSVVYINNSDQEGAGGIPKKPMSVNNVNDEISRIFNLGQRMLMTSLRCDGGTGHIDIYTKMSNDEEILITKYPDAYNRLQFPDYATANNNRNLILSKTNAYKKQYRFLEVPLPTDDDGKYNRTSCNNFNLDARGYINGLTINKTFLVPTYSNSVSGNSAGDKAALDIIRKHMPGYKVVPIDSRTLTPLGGALHCITMQIPAENPVYIKHAQYKGEYYFPDILENGSKIPMIGKIRNKSGFKSGKMHYKCASSEEWLVADVAITTDEEGSISDFKFDTEIDFYELACGYKNDINYYFEFETNNGKTAYRPFTGPVGYYTFNVSDMPSSVNTGLDISRVQLYPNPASDMVYITLPDSYTDLKIEISDILGNVVGSYSITGSESVAALNVSDYQSGLYICKISDGNQFRILKLIVTK